MHKTIHCESAKRCKNRKFSETLTSFQTICSITEIVCSRLNYFYSIIFCFACLTKWNSENLPVRPPFCRESQWEISSARPSLHCEFDMKFRRILSEMQKIPNVQRGDVYCASGRRAGLRFNKRSFNFFFDPISDLCALNQSQVWNICKLFSQWQPVIVDVFLVRKLTHGVWITCNNVGQKYLFGKLCFADVMYKDPATRIGVVWAFLWSYHHAISLH